MQKHKTKIVVALEDSDICTSRRKPQYFDVRTLF